MSCPAGDTVCPAYSWSGCSLPWLGRCGRSGPAGIGPAGFHLTHAAMTPDSHKEKRNGTPRVTIEVRLLSDPAVGGGVDCQLDFGWFWPEPAGRPVCG